MSELSVFLRHAKRSNTKELDLSKRQLSLIPKEIFTMRAIETLNLSDNKIVSIEPAISDLFRLRVLNLENNCLVELPEQLGSLPKISKILFKGNPLDKRFQKLLQPANQEVPQLLECLQACFESKTEKASQAPSWLTEGDSRATKAEESKGNDIKWDQSIFKVESKRSDPRTTQSNFRRNVDAKVNQQTSDQAYETPSKNGVLEPRLEDLEIHEQISMGGFSTIHRGCYQGLEVVVKKMFNPQVNQEVLAEFENELQMLAKYRHPQIVLLLAAVTVPPTLCMVMEYVKGGTLYELLHKKKAKLSEGEQSRLVQQLISGFMYLGRHGIVHRDIKSHNILVDEHLNIKICDFGLARHKSNLNCGPMQFSGTPTYMAQELFLKKAYDESVDIFALGTLLYEIYAREVPYAGLDPADIKDKILGNSDLPNKLNQVPKGVLQIINRCRKEDPAQRPSYQELKDFKGW